MDENELFYVKLFLVDSNLTPKNPLYLRARDTALHFYSQNNDQIKASLVELDKQFKDYFCSIMKSEWLKKLHAGQSDLNLTASDRRNLLKLMTTDFSSKPDGFSANPYPVIEANLKFISEKMSELDVDKRKVIYRHLAAAASQCVPRWQSETTRIRLELDEPLGLKKNSIIFSRNTSKKFISGWRKKSSTRVRILPII